MKEIVDYDASTIIGTGKKFFLSGTSGLRLPRITPEIQREICNKDGLIPLLNNCLDNGSIILGDSAPVYSQFICLYSDDAVELDTYTSNTGATFFIQRYMCPKPITTLCGQHKHLAEMIINYNNHRYVLCENNVHHKGDNSIVWNFIQYPEKYFKLETRDPCLAHTINKIIELRK